MKNHRKNIQKLNSSRMLLIPLFLLLIVGTITSVYQSSQKQNLKSEAAAIDCAVPSTRLTMSVSEQSMLDKINQYRQQNNLPILVDSLPLKQAAAWMSNDMLTEGLLSHVDSLGRDTAARLSNCGLPFPSIIAEIIDSGNADPAIMIEAWKHSSAHSNRILNKNFTHIGVSLMSNTTSGQSYWSVTFSGPDQTITLAPSILLTPSVYPSSSITPSTGSPTRTPTPSKTPTPTITIKPATPTPTKPVIITPTPTNKPIPIPTKGPIATATPTPFPTIDPKYVQNPDDTQIYVSVKVPGIGPDGVRNPKHLSRRIQATFYNTKNTEVKVGTADLRFNGDVFQGNMHMGILENGIYSIKISGIRTLKNVVEPQFQRISNERLNVLPQVTLRQGDVSEDNALTLDDYNLVLACFQDKICKRDAQDFIDFNDSGAADVVDYNLLLQSFYKLTGD